MTSPGIHQVFSELEADEEIRNEFTTFTMGLSRNLIEQDQLRRDVMIDYSLGPSGLLLLPNIAIIGDLLRLIPNSTSVADMQRFVNNDNNASCLYHASELAPKTKGSTRTRGETADKSRSYNIQNLRCDFNQDNPTYPVILKNADCFLSLFILNFVCPDLDSYLMHLKKMSAMIKLGGSLILCGLFDAKYFSYKGNEYRVLNFDQTFITESLANNGFTVEYSKSIPSKVNKAVADFGTLWCIHAIKKLSNKPASNS